MENYDQSSYQRAQKRERGTSRLIRSIGVLIALIAMPAAAYLALHVSRDAAKDSTATLGAASDAARQGRYNLSEATMPTASQGAIAVVEDNMNIHASDDQLWPMASITKVVTALAILDKAPIELGEQGDTITLNQQDEDYFWEYAELLGTLTPVTAGYEMSQYEVLQTMLLASSNNMTDTLVDRYFDSMDDFVDHTNQLLESRGYVHTRVADAAGFSPNSVSTPTEMVRIGAWALEHPVIAEIVAQPSATTRVAGWVPNYNVLIDRPGVTGIKPGVTDESGHNLLFSSETTNKDGELVTVIGIVMGSFDRQEHISSLTTLLNSAETLVSTQ